MQSLAERVYRSIQRDLLLPPGARVVVAASGGADSTALVLLLAELAPRGGFVVASLAHFNHCLRGAESDADQAACARLAERLGLPFDTERGDAREAARRWRTSIEDAGRRLRYEFFARTAAARGAQRIAVGHTRDDQAETVLLHLLRGTGGKGRAGMASRRGDIVRPLLDCRHDELVDWLSQRGESFREDSSNLDRRYVRNRIRRELIPFLKERFSPSVVEVLARGAELARDEAELLDQLSRDWFSRVVSVVEARVEVDSRLLQQAPRVLATRVCRSALEVFAGSRGIGLDHAAALLAFASGREEMRRDFPGQRARRRGEVVVLEPVSSAERAARRGRRSKSDVLGAVGIPDPNSFVQKLSIPGEVLVEGTGLTVSAELRRSEPERGFSSSDIPGGPRQVAVDAAAAGTLAVRTRRAGDRFRPLGSPGRKKLQDYFVDRKVPRDDRDRVPLVTTGDGRIVWVAGHGIAEEFRVRADTVAVVILSLRGEIA